MENKKGDVQTILSFDVKLVIATAGIVATVLGTFFAVKTDVALLSQKLDSAVALLKTQQGEIVGITSADATRDSRIAVLEFKTK